MRARTNVMLALCVLALGCGERREGFDVPPRVVDRARLGSELVFLDASRDEADALDVMTKEPTAKVTRIAVGAAPRLAVERSTSNANPVLSASSVVGATTSATIADSRLPPDELLVLCDGKRDAGGDYVEKPSLTVVKTNHETRRYELSSPLEQVELSSDGRYALVWGQPTSGDSSGLLNNPNRVALIDLDQAPSDTNPWERTLKATGGSVSSVLITPPISYGGGQYPVALFGFSNGLNIWDLAHPANEDITVEGLSVSGTFRLKRVAVDRENAQIYLIQEDQGDLRVLSFAERDPNGTNEFRLVLNQLPLGTTLASDMVFYTDLAVPKVLVAAGNRLGIVDANDGRLASVALPAKGDRLYSFVGKSPNDNDVKQRVVVWGSGQSSVSFVELENLEKAGTQNIELLPLGGTFVLSSLVTLSENLLLTVLNGGGIGTLDLEARRFRPLSSKVELSAPTIESDARRVWVGGDAQSGAGRVGYFEPTTLATDSLLLDNAVQELFLFEQDNRRRLVVSHDSLLGEVTIVDATKATRASSLVLTGFLADGWVDR